MSSASDDAPASSGKSDNAERRGPGASRASDADRPDRVAQDRVAQALRDNLRRRKAARRPKPDA